MSFVSLSSSSSAGTPRKAIWFLLLLLLTSGAVSPSVAQDELPSSTMPQRRGEVVVKVEQFEMARERILKALAIQGAEMIDAKTLVNEKGRKNGWVTVRINGDRLPDALPVIRAAGKLYAEDIATADKTSEFESLAKRTQRLREH